MSAASASESPPSFPKPPRYGISYMTSERTNVEEKMKVMLYLEGPDVWIPLWVPLTKEGKWGYQFPSVKDVKETLKTEMKEWLDDVPIEKIELYIADESAYPPLKDGDQLDNRWVLNERGRTVVHVEWPNGLRACDQKGGRHDDDYDQSYSGRGYYEDDGKEMSEKDDGYWHLGFDTGFDKGFEKGFQKGQGQDGYKSGFKEGYKRGYEARMYGYAVPEDLKGIVTDALGSSNDGGTLGSSNSEGQSCKSWHDIATPTEDGPRTCDESRARREAAVRDWGPK